MEEEKVELEKEETKDKKGKHAKKQHNGLRVIGIILFILVAIFIGNTIRKFYILNTYTVATSIYKEKDNYKKTITQSNGTKDGVQFTIQGYKKGDKTLVTSMLSGERKLVSYYDAQTKESIVKIDSNGDKVAIVKQDEDMSPAPSIDITGWYTTDSAWLNFLMALQSKITSEECNGKQCYKIEINGAKIWIDKETHLDTKTINGYTKNSQGVETPNIQDYEYEFDTVTDEQVKKPDITGYKVQ